MKLSTRILDLSKERRGESSLPLLGKVSTIFFRNSKIFRNRLSRKEKIYGIEGMEINRRLERVIGYIEGGKYCLLVSSGLMAIMLVYMALIRRGDIILTTRSIYEPSIRALKFIKVMMKVKVGIYRERDSISSIKKKFRKIKRIRFLFMEIPSSIKLRIGDVGKLIKFVKEKEGRIVMDNTYSGGVFFRSIRKGVDVTIQAITKYQGGNNDLLMGAIIVKERKIFRRIKRFGKILGINVEQIDCYLTLRNIRNLIERIRIQGRNAFKIGKWLRRRKEVKEVFHPYLRSRKESNRFKKCFNGSNGLISFILKNKYILENNWKFIDQLRLFRLGYSWGGAISLVMGYQMKHINKEFMIIRLSIGLESVNDLINDLRKGFSLLKLI